MLSRTYSILLYFVAQDPFADAKALRGLGLDPMLLMKGLDDQILFDLLQGLGEPFLLWRSSRSFPISPPGDEKEDPEW